MIRSLHIVLACVMPHLLAAQEVCNNGVDDDANGLIDLNDPGCPCSTAIIPEDVGSYIYNHSFEEQVIGPNGPCCPYGFVAVNTAPWLSCADGWHQATAATSDYFHECGYSPVGMPLPPPDGLGALGFYAMTGYKEYVGTCLTATSPPNPLIAGTTYTLSLWIAAAAANGMHTQTQADADPSIFPEQLPLAIFGYANACMAFPVGTDDCIGTVPGWEEMGRVLVQPAWEWTRVSITFTPTENIHSVIIGSACEIPASFTSQYTSGENGPVTVGSPYFLVDDLMLTEAQDQVLSPVVTSGSICREDALAVASPPPGASGYQWYRDGVAVFGQTAITLDISQLDLDGGMYTLGSTYQDQCLMGSAAMLAAVPPAPMPFMEPSTGCAPLEVMFTDTSANSLTSLWAFGDGGSSTEETGIHTYMAPGTYDVTLTITDVLGCTGDTTLVDAVVAEGVAQAEINATPNPTDVENTSVTLSAAGSSGDIVSWWWDLGDVPPVNSTAATLIVDFPAEPGNYPVLLAVRTEAGCVDTVRSEIVITLNGEIEMPNIFSPNGDGHNDRFLPIDLEGVAGRMEIFNRWGQSLYSTSALDQGWNGKADGSDVPAGTYYYIVTPTRAEDAVLTGHVTLTR